MFHGPQHIRLILQKAHLEFNFGNVFDKMDPFVYIRIGQQEWRSAVCVDGGKNPHWQG